MVDTFLGLNSLHWTLIGVVIGIIGIMIALYKIRKKKRIGGNGISKKIVGGDDTKGDKIGGHRLEGVKVERDLIINSPRSPIKNGQEEDSSVDCIYSSIQRATERMDKIIEQNLSNNKETKIQVMGLALQHMWEYVKNFINKPETKRFNIQLSMVDSNSPVIRGLGNDWDKLSDSYYSMIQNHIEKHKEDLDRRDIKIEITRFKHVPIVHGILIDEEHLFLSYTYWTSANQLEGASEFYIYYNVNTEIGALHVKMFKNWFNHIRKNLCDNLCMKEFKQRIPPPEGGGCIGHEMMSKAVVGENDDKLEARGPRRSHSDRRACHRLQTVVPPRPVDKK